MYSNMIFSFQRFDLFAAHRFLTSINPESLNVIRTINLHLCVEYPMYLRGRRVYYEGRELDASAEEERWEEIWRILSQMVSLRHVCVKIFDHGYALNEDMLLKPLQALNFETFIVQLPWSAGFGQIPPVILEYQEHRISGEGYNFELLRPDDHYSVTRNNNQSLGLYRRPTRR